MQLLALNALLLFDAIFIFFLFLVSVSCLLYYLPLVPPTRSSSLTNMDEDIDLESALVVESSREPCTGQASYSHPHYCHHHHHHLIRDHEESREAEFQQNPCSGCPYEDLEMGEHDPSPTANPSPMHHPVNPTPVSKSQHPPAPRQDHPATHIIMTPPQRKYYQSGDKGQPFAPVETV